MKKSTNNAFKKEAILYYQQKGTPLKDVVVEYDDDLIQPLKLNLPVDTTGLNLQLSVGNLSIDIPEVEDILYEEVDSKINTANQELSQSTEE